MASLGTRMSVLALIIWDSNSAFLISAYLGLCCSTRDEHHVMVSPPGTFSNMFSFTPCSGHSLRGFCRWFGTGHGFLATGIASGSVSSLTSISLPVLLSQKHPMPWNLSLYSLSNTSMSSGGFTDLILSSSVHVSLSVPLGLILIIASSISAFLLKSGGESIFPSITEHLLFAPWFLFRIVVWNSPLTTPVYYQISLESLQCFFAWIYIVVLWFPLICVFRAPNWYSSIMFTLALLSGSTCALVSPILIKTESWVLPDLSFFAQCKAIMSCCLLKVFAIWFTACVSVCLGCFLDIFFSWLFAFLLSLVWSRCVVYDTFS